MTTIKGILVCLASFFYWTSGVEEAEATTRRTEDITGNSGQQCCNQKSVGDYEYKLINMENTSAHQCKDGCVYTRYGEQSSRYCFKVGNQPASCLPLEKSCQNEALSIGINGHCTEECQIDTESACNTCLSEKMRSECLSKDTALCIFCTPCFIYIPYEVATCIQFNPWKWAECVLHRIPSRCKSSDICRLIGKVDTKAGIGCTCLETIATVPEKVVDCEQDNPVKWAVCILDKIPSSCKSEICELIGDVKKIAGEGCTCVITAPGVLDKCYKDNKPSVPSIFECAVADLPQDCIDSACYLIGKAFDLGPEFPVFCDCIADAVQDLDKCYLKHKGDWETIMKCTLEKAAVTCIKAVCKYAERKFPEIKKTPVCGCLAATLVDVIQCYENASNKSDWPKIIDCTLKSAATNCRKDVCIYAGKMYPEILKAPACRK